MSVTVNNTDATSVASQQQLVDVVQLAVTNLNNTNQATSSGEPLEKRMKITIADEEMNSDASIKTLLFNINKAVCLRLDSIESKLDGLIARQKQLEDKVDQVSTQVRQTSMMTSQSKGLTTPRRTASGAVIVGLPQSPPSLSNSADIGTSSASLGSVDQSIQNLGPNVQLITLNTEEDFPHGVWLGDETNPEMRVRVPITPSDLLHIHSNCRTPEKMALTLLDYLFDRETQASSNLSGMGKHGKKQLDPLMIYGIRCHLIFKFEISEADWHRIKLNIDSKCRTAHRRKAKGLPLTIKSFRGKAAPTYVHKDGLGEELELEMSSDQFGEDGPGELLIQQEGVDFSGELVSGPAELIQSAGGQIQVLHATPEQVAQLQQAHQIQILQGDSAAQVIGLHGEGNEQLHVAVSLAQTADGIVQVVNADNGEAIQICSDIKGEVNTSSETDP